MKENEFRILGAELGETDSFIDVTIDGIDEEGQIYFSEKNSDRGWDLGNREVRNLINRNLMLGSSKVKNHKLWKAAETVGANRVDDVTDDFADENTEDAQESLFLAAYFETR